MAASLKGTYKLEKNDNFDKFMEVIGVGYATRKIGGSITNTNQFIVEGEKVKILQKSTFKNWEIEFELGKELEVKTVDGRQVKTIFTWEDNKLVQKEWPVKDPSLETTYIRELDGQGKLIATCKCKDVTCVRTYTKIADS